MKRRLHLNYCTSIHHDDQPSTVLGTPHNEDSIEDCSLHHLQNAGKYPKHFNFE